MNNTGVTGQFLPPKTDFECAYVIPPTHFRTRQTYRHIYIYISREISIEHPSVGLASLAQLRTEKHREVGRGVSVLRRCGSVMEGVMALPRRRHGCKIRWAEIVRRGESLCGID